MEVNTEPHQTSILPSSQSQQIPLDKFQWMLIRHLDDGSFWVVPVFYLQNFLELEESCVEIGSFVNSHRKIWSGPQGGPVWLSGGDSSYTNNFRDAKIFCIKETACCAARIYHLSTVIKREGGTCNTVVENLSQTLREPDLDLFLSDCAAQDSAGNHPMTSDQSEHMGDSSHSSRNFNEETYKSCASIPSDEDLNFQAGQKWTDSEGSDIDVPCDEVSNVHMKEDASWCPDLAGEGESTCFENSLECGQRW